MLSILIPIYNFKVVELVETLLKQAKGAGVPFEICCFDDGSVARFKIQNSRLNAYPQVIYRELPQNVGRSKIRNLLAQKAAYPYLLFMDCDSRVVKADYIQSYTKHLPSEKVLYGGRSYASQVPNNPDLALHWLFGTKREAASPEKRTQEPYESFMTNNFLIPKQLFQKIRFDERLVQYGHEDTLFGYQLKEAGVSILHLDNPLEHIGLEETEVFLRKVNKSVENLWYLYQNGMPLPTKLMKTFLLLKKYRISSFAQFCLKRLEPSIYLNLNSGTPNLRYLDFFKLICLFRAEKGSR